MKRIYSPLCVAAFALAATSLSAATTAPQARITLVEHNAALGVQPGADPSIARKRMPGLPDREAHLFVQKIQVGTTRTEIVELAFHAKTSVTTIEATNDFHVVSGGSCQENKVYNSGDSCTVDVAFKGMGPGRRAGQLKFGTAEFGQAEAIGLQGQTYGAALAFTPALITTLPQSLPNGSPLLYVPGDVAVDQGDNLYISDVQVGAAGASGKVYFLDASNNLITIAGGGANNANNKVNKDGGQIFATSAYLSLPVGLAADSWLDLYIAESGFNTIDQYSQTNLLDAVGLGATQPAGANCTPSSPCTGLSVELNQPYWVGTDTEDNFFFDDSNGFYSATPGTIYKASEVTNLINSYYAGLTTPLPFGLDSEDNLYALRDLGYNICQIEGWTPSSNFAWAAVGSQECGYAGNNVRAQNAEIQSWISGYANDAAGDMYIADYYNNVLRRVDNNNGLIRTVAGDFALGANYTGDGGPATAATLNGPIGVAVDSNGVIYTASYVATATSGIPNVVSKVGTGTAETVHPDICVSNCGPSTAAVVRKIGPQGQQNFPTTLVGQSSPVNTILLTNVGNDSLIVSNEILGGADPGDFVADPATTSCTWGTSTPMYAGVSCQLGYRCAPKAAGLRTATVTLVDNTATFQNVLNLSCYAIASPVTPTVVVAPPASGASYPYLTSVPIVVTVSNSIPNTPPTGTVTLTITNTTTSTVYTTIGPLALTPAKFGSSSTASYTLPGGGTLKVASYSIVAKYSGDTDDSSASSIADPFSVTPLTPTITWSPSSPVIAGNPITSAQLDAKVTFNGVIVPGSLTYTVYPSTTTICTSAQTTAALTCTPPTTVDLDSIGTVTLDMAFTPTDTVDYTAPGASVNISVVQLVPTINWNSPAAVDPGVSLGATQFDATVTYNSVGLPGVYNYSVIVNSTSTTICNNGKYDVSPACSTPYITTTAEEGTDITLYVNFVPTNSITYTSVQAEVQLPVLIVTTIVHKTGTSLVSKSNPVLKGGTVELHSSVTDLSGNIMPTGKVTLLEGRTSVATANLSSGTATFTLKGLSAGTHTLTAEYGGDSEHQGSTSKLLQQLVVTVNGEPVRAIPSQGFPN